MPRLGQHHKTNEPGTHYLQASGSAVFPYPQVTKATPAPPWFGVPGSSDKKKGGVSPDDPQTNPRTLKHHQERFHSDVTKS
jgi:hypothetical protein